MRRPPHATPNTSRPYEGVLVMSKSKDTKKDTKKAATKTPKEKKEAKKQKKELNKRG
jgi:hypothetical protein